MTARRAQIAALREVTRSAGNLPRVIAVGKCIEVWADDPGAPDALLSTYRRYSIAAHTWWTENRTTGCLRGGGPWSLTEEPGRVSQRLRRAGCTKRDVPALRAEADALFAAAIKQRRSQGGGR